MPASALSEMAREAQFRIRRYSPFRMKSPGKPAVHADCRLQFASARLVFDRFQKCLENF